MLKDNKINICKNDLILSILNLFMLKQIKLLSALLDSRINKVF